MDMATFLGLPDMTVQHIELADDQIIIQITPSTRIATCPSCTRSSTQVHSYYTRSVTDLAVGQRSHLLRLRVRRFRCRTATCSTRTFTEQVRQVVRPRCRRTVRVQHLLTHLALAIGGEGGARLTGPLHRVAVYELSHCLLLRYPKSWVSTTLRGGKAKHTAPSWLTSPRTAQSICCGHSGPACLIDLRPI